MGRVLVYADTLRSTMDITAGSLAHGVGAVARRQTAGRGRGANGWLSPPGQASITLQVWQKMSSTLPIIQHASALAVVRAIRSQPTYEHLDIRIKWPNDIYYGREVKIGGTIANADCKGDDVIINIGTGVNISNSVPTTCVNDIIREHNKVHKTSLAPMSIESFLARYCSQLERILQYVASDGGVDAFREQYYQYWLHDGEEILVASKDNSEPIRGTVHGVDDTGWLLVKTERGEIRVEPDGNTFDMMSGLLAPKVS